MELVAEKSNHGDDLIDGGLRKKSGAATRAKKVKKRRADGTSTTTASKFKRSKKGALYTGHVPEKLMEPVDIETSDQTYQFNLINAKVLELLKEIVYSKSQQAAINVAFAKLKKAVNRCQHVPYNKLSVKLPDTNLHMMPSLAQCQYIQPNDVQLMGSYVHNMALRSAATVDVRIIIPKKDYLNQRYLLKKAYYLACIAHNLYAKRDLSCQLGYVSPQENPLDIALSVQLKDSITFLLHAHLEEDTMTASRFGASKNNVRPNHVQTTPITVDDTKLPSTPLYNMTALMNLVYSHSDNVLAQYVQSNDVVKNVMCLLHIWLHQRQLDQGFGCFSGFISRMFVIYLLKSRKIKQEKSAYRMFMHVLAQLASLDWSDGISLNKDEPTEVLASHCDISEVVFLDPSGQINYCAAMSAHTVQQVQSFAKESLEWIIADKDPFNHLFISRAPFHLRYDCYVRIGIKSNQERPASSTERYIDSCGDQIFSIVPDILETLSKGLGDRVTCMSVAPIRRNKVSVQNVTDFTCIEKNLLVIGFHVNPDTAYNTVERGPSADDPLAAEFRQFWGEKSNLRRFLDGAVCEAVVWEAKTLSSKRTLLGHIVSYVLNMHCGIHPAKTMYAVNQLDEVLMYSDLSIRSKKNRHNAGTGEEEHLPVISAFQTVAKHLRAIKSLPLSIVDVQPVDPVNSFTKVFPPKGSQTVQGTLYSYPPMRVICTLEGSSRWPQDNDPRAVSSLKTILLLKIRESLTDIDSVTALIHSDKLTVAQGGYLFDVELLHKTELNYLRRSHDDEKRLHKFTQSVLLPQLTSVLHGFHLQHSSFGGAARLFKRWAGVHLLTQFLPEPVTDLITAHVFLHPKPMKLPRCPMMAFLRILQLIIYHDWTREPLIVNFNDELSVDKIEEIQADVACNRSNYPCAIIITPYDLDSYWTKRLAPYMMKHILQTAQHCFTVAEALMSSGSWYTKPMEDALFTPVLDEFDVVISLKPLSDRQQQCSLSQPGASQIQVEFDPANDFISHIRTLYGDIAVVMFSAEAPKHIGFVWKPIAHQSHPVKGYTGSMYSRKLVEVDGDLHVQLDVTRLVHDLEIVGQELIASITVHSAD